MKNLIETHGQDESQPEVKSKYQPTLLEQVWGADNMSKYGTLEEEDYLSKLGNMTRSDLEAHARQMGVVIVEHTPRLREKLLSEFRGYASLVRKPAAPIVPNSKINDAAQKVLAEGR